MIRCFHKFSPETHRCVRCYRWQNGFKPKKPEAEAQKGECQVCARKQCLTGGGALVHHGYRRPGYGSIVGDCFGVGHLPYPKTDALEKYVVALEQEVSRLNDQLANIPNVLSIFHTRGDKVTVEVKRGDAGIFDPDWKRCVPSFETLLDRLARKLQSQINYAKQELVRVRERIAAASSL